MEIEKSRVSDSLGSVESVTQEGVGIHSYRRVEDIIMLKTVYGLPTLENHPIGSFIVRDDIEVKDKFWILGCKTHAKAYADFK